jgi:hypothetical protein
VSKWWDPLNCAVWQFLPDAGCNLYVFGGYWFFSYQVTNFLLGVEMMGSSKFHGVDIFI